jgi:hypothetical protein
MSCDANNDSFLLEGDDPSLYSSFKYDFQLGHWLLKFGTVYLFIINFFASIYAVDFDNKSISHLLFHCIMNC